MKEKESSRSKRVIESSLDMWNWLVPRKDLYPEKPWLFPAVIGIQAFTDAASIVTMLKIDVSVGIIFGAFVVGGHIMGRRDCGDWRVKNG